MTIVSRTVGSTVLTAVCLLLALTIGGSEAGCTYTIKAGDTLWQLSQTLKTTVAILQNMNPGIVATNLQIGQVINVPCRGGTSCQSLSGYTATPDVDHYGDDIRNTGSLNAAVQACTADASCLGFNSNGWIKRVVSPTAPYSGVCFYVKQKKQTACSTISGYKVTPDVDHTGDDIGNMESLNAAVQACSADSSCRGFNSYGWIKRVVSPTTPHNGLCLYTKTAPPPNSVCKTVGGYTSQPNVDHYGDDIDNYGTNTAAAAQACTANSKCAGFNSDGWIKTTVSPTRAANGYCLYTKIESNPPPINGGIMLSAYKDITVSLNWNTNVMSSTVTGTSQTVLQAMSGNLNVLTWAFATGQCGSENWAGVRPADLVAANMASWVSAGKKYIISTGGAAGVFTCGSDSGFNTFVDRYMSSSLVGVDFDIEGGQSQSDINNLVARVKAAKSRYPGLRWSFTLATMNGATGDQLNILGTWTMQALQSANMGWNNVFVNLMVMDYGGPVSDMGQSAINAAKAMNSYWKVPYSSIELTPMIGGNDSPGETFTLTDVATMSSFVKSNGLGGVHYWSFDRDRDCPPGSASATCNTYGQAGTLGFAKAFISRLK